MTLYFNDNDEMVDEEEVQQCKDKKKYHSVTVDFGNEDFIRGTEKITKDFFWSNKKSENAEIFVDNYMKAKAHHKKKKLIEEESSDSEDSSVDDIKMFQKGNKPV